MNQSVSLLQNRKDVLDRLEATIVQAAREASRLADALANSQLTPPEAIRQVPAADLAPFLDRFRAGLHAAGRRAEEVDRILAANEQRAQDVLSEVQTLRQRLANWVASAV